MNKYSNQFSFCFYICAVIDKHFCFKCFFVFKPFFYSFQVKACVKRRFSLIQFFNLIRTGSSFHSKSSWGSCTTVRIGTDFLILFFSCLVQNIFHSYLLVHNRYQFNIFWIKFFVNKSFKPVLQKSFVSFLISCFIKERKDTC